MLALVPRGFDAEPLGPSVIELQPDAQAIPGAMEPEKRSAMREGRPRPALTFLKPCSFMAWYGFGAAKVRGQRGKPAIDDGIGIRKMANWPAPQPSERRISAIDRFCMLTYQTSAEAARYAWGVVPTLGLLCLVLVLSLGATVWHANAMEQERDRLVQELRSERAARIEATLAVKDVEMNVATYALDTQVRRDLVEERMLQQEQRSTELDQLVQRVEREKLIKADCITPRSIIAAGL